MSSLFPSNLTVPSGFFVNPNLSSLMSRNAIFDFLNAFLAATSSSSLGLSFGNIASINSVAIPFVISFSASAFSFSPAGSFSTRIFCLSLANSPVSSLAKKSYLVLYSSSVPKYFGSIRLLSNNFILMLSSSMSIRTSFI